MAPGTFFGNFYFLVTVIIHFLDRPYWEINFKSHIKSVLKKHIVSFAYVPCNLISFYLFQLSFAMKLKSANCKNYWNILVFVEQWKMMSGLNMTHGKMFDFVSFPLLGFTLVIKLRYSDLESNWNTLIFFYKNGYGIRIDYVKICPVFFVLFVFFWHY